MRTASHLVKKRDDGFDWGELKWEVKGMFVFKESFCSYWSWKYWSYILVINIGHKNWSYRYYCTCWSCPKHSWLSSVCWPARGSATQICKLGIIALPRWVLGGFSRIIQKLCEYQTDIVKWWWCKVGMLEGGKLRISTWLPLQRLGWSMCQWSFPWSVTR